MKNAFNALSDKNEASIVYQTSEVRGCSASNILNDNHKRLWLSEQGLPQEIVIDVSKSNQPSRFFRFFGWFCWHSYKSNPAVVELWTSEEGSLWQIAGSFQGKAKSGYNCFQIECVDKQVKFIKVVVNETFGAANTYLNQVFLLEDPLEDSFEGSRGSIDEKFIEIDKSSEPRSPIFSSVDEVKRTPQKDFFREIPVSSSFSERNLINTLPKIDEMGRLKKEVHGWAGDISGIQRVLNALSEKVDKLQGTVNNKAGNELMQDIKEEIRKITDGEEMGKSDKEPFEGLRKYEEMFRKNMKIWEETVFIKDLERIKMSAGNSRPAPQEILQRLDAKLKYRAKLVKRKELIQKFRYFHNKCTKLVR